jgi:hypothetical protein
VKPKRELKTEKPGYTRIFEEYAPEKVRSFCIRSSRIFEDCEREEPPEVRPFYIRAIYGANRPVRLYRFEGRRGWSAPFGLCNACKAYRNVFEGWDMIGTADETPMPCQVCGYRAPLPPEEIGKDPSATAGTRGEP